MLRRRSTLPIACREVLGALRSSSEAAAEKGSSVSGLLSFAGRGGVLLSSLVADEADEEGVDDEEDSEVMDDDASDVLGEGLREASEEDHREVEKSALGWRSYGCLCGT